MGQRGPVPKRSDERRRRNKESEPDKVRAIVEHVVVPKPSLKWHPIAKAWYEALAESGQSKFYEPSDWAAAQYVAESMSINLRQAKARFSAVLFSAVWTAMGDLLTTEAERRRVRMEIDRGAEQLELPAGVAAIEDYRRELGSG